MCAGLCAGAATVLLASALLGHPPDAPVYLARDGSGPASYIRGDRDLGYAPIPGASVRARRTIGGRTVYDVVYTIDGAGLRATPGDRDAPAIVFFGGSFTFGEGLDDDQAIPWLVADALGRRMNVVNAGFQGYGPHQMLRLLETGRLRDRVPGGVAQVVYLAIGDHVRRAAGKARWDLAGPRYGLDGAGVRYAGPFHGPVVAHVLRYANRLRATLLPAGDASPPPTEEDRERFVRIVVAAAGIVRMEWGAPFTALFWDDGDLAEDLIARLVARGIVVLRVSTIIPPDVRESALIPLDGHPGPGATRLLATALAARFDGALGDAEQGARSLP